MLASESTGHLWDKLRVLVGRDFSMRYKGSYFGITWAVLTPIANVAILHFLFSTILHMAQPHFTVFLYTGLLSFNWFQTSTIGSCSIITGNRDLVRTPFFSKALLPLTVTCTHFIFYLMSLPVLVGLMYYEGLPLTSAVIALPAVWLVQWVLTLGVAQIMAAIGILIRDWEHLMGIIMMFWFYLTPIFYDSSQLPPAFRTWFLLNPLTPIVLAHRAIILDGRMPDWTLLGLVLIAGIVLFGISVLIFRALEDLFVDHI